jgi:predicted DNA-binding transcriptional regulator YafY
MSTETLNRFDRIVAIYIHLQSSRVVRAQELSERFNVSLRTIYRDIKSLETSGVPISGEAGIGYSIMEGYRLPPVMFTIEEATSFVAAEKLMQKFTDKKLRSHFESAMYKLKSVLRGKSKDQISALQSKIWINPAQELFNENLPDALEILLESMAEKLQVNLTYRTFSSNEVSNRIIEPIALFHENNYWYVKAFCHLRLDYRKFRTDRMVKIFRTSNSFVNDHLNIQESGENDEYLRITKVVISMHKDDVRYVQNSRKYYGFESEVEKGELVEMTFMCNDLEHGMARWFIMFGDCAKIIEPDSLKELVKDIAGKIQMNIQN